jgi:hypothetical protein
LAEACTTTGNLCWVTVALQPIAAVTLALHGDTHENGGSDEISVAGLAGVLADGQDAATIQGIDVSEADPTNGQVLKYSSSGTAWTPAADATE